MLLKMAMCIIDSLRKSSACLSLYSQVIWVLGIELAILLTEYYSEQVNRRIGNNLKQLSLVIQEALHRPIHPVTFPS